MSGRVSSTFEKRMVMSDSLNPESGHIAFSRSALARSLAGHVIVAFAFFASCSWPRTPELTFCASAEKLVAAGAEVGRYGGRVAVAERTEPTTLNPVTAIDLSSRDVIKRLNADLIHINCGTQLAEPSLAKRWKV